MVQGLGFLSKKSWHTKNKANQEKVWIAEEQKKAEEAKTKELARQIQQEREEEEFAKISGKKTTVKDRGIDWMYQGNAAGSELAKQDAEKKQEEYLLGKEFVEDGAVKGDFDDGQKQPDGIHNVVTNAATTSSAGPKSDMKTAPSMSHYGPASSENVASGRAVAAASSSSHLEASVASRNEEFRMRMEDPMFLVSQKQHEKQLKHDKAKALYEKVVGPTASDDDDDDDDDGKSPSRDTPDDRDRRRKHKRSKKSKKEKKRHKKSKKDSRKSRKRHRDRDDRYSSSDEDDDSSNYSRQDRKKKRRRGRDRSSSRSRSRSPARRHYSPSSSRSRSRSRSPSYERHQYHGKKHDDEYGHVDRDRSRDSSYKDGYDHHHYRDRHHHHRSDRDTYRRKENDRDRRYRDRPSFDHDSNGDPYIDRSSDGRHSRMKDPPKPQGSSSRDDGPKKIEGYGLKGSSNGQEQVRNLDDLGPSRELLQKKRDEVEGERRRIREVASSRKRVSQQDRKRALEEMQADAKKLESRAERQGLHRKEDTEDEFGRAPRGSASFLDDIQKQSHGLTGTSTLASRVAQNRHTQQRNHESFF